MDLSDKLSIAISALALVVSVVTGFLNYRHTKKTFEASYRPAVLCSLRLIETSEEERAETGLATRLSVAVRNLSTTTAVREVAVMISLSVLEVPKSPFRGFSVRYNTSALMGHSRSVTFHNLTLDWVAPLQQIEREVDRILEAFLDEMHLTYGHRTVKGDREGAFALKLDVHSQFNPPKRYSISDVLLRHPLRVLVTAQFTPAVANASRTSSSRAYDLRPRYELRHESEEDRTVTLTGWRLEEAA